MRIFRALVVFILLFNNPIFASDLSFADNLKSKMIEHVVSAYFAIKGYGLVKKIELNSIDKTIAIRLMPEGETQELNILVGNYSLVEKERKIYIVLNKITTNRIWLNRIFADHMPNGISVPLDESVAAFGKTVF